MIYLSPLDDSQQDVAIGDFRAYCRELLGASSILEIGPSYMPLFPKKEGFDVSIVDHADGDTIREKYKSMGVDTSLIEDVDYVWKGGPISGLLDGKKFDCIYSSHVIEHTTDFVRFLQDCEVILNSSGLLVFIIPDKRFCFDLLQPITDTAKIISDYERNSSKHSLESLYRETSQVTAKYGDKDLLAWWQGEVSGISFMCSDPRVKLDTLYNSSTSNDYVDAHEYFFTPSSFYLLIEELRFLGFIQLEIQTITRARGCEFLAILRGATSSASDASEFCALKKELSLNIIREQTESWSNLSPLANAFDKKALKRRDFV